MIADRVRLSGLKGSEFMEKVAYVLGAGFSAPLGLPLMRNFIGKAKDLQEADPEQWAYFKGIHEMIKRDLGFTNSVYETDLTNIENVLSIIEMLEYLDDAGEETRFRNYIIDVIRSYTPRDLEIPKGTAVTDAKGNITLPLDPTLRPYLMFVFMLLGYTGRRDDSPNRVVRYGTNEEVEYGVITLNYDLVLEQLARILHMATGSPRQFTRPAYVGVDGYERARLAKLHGSVDSARIIAPTWNKNLIDDDVTEEWRLAFTMLSEAHHIRFLGYSLPETDSYVKYLFRAAATKTENLKYIDVICIDPNGTVEERYREFVKWPDFRFVNRPISRYFEHLGQVMQNRLIGHGRALERAHQEYFEQFAHQ